MIKEKKSDKKEHKTKKEEKIKFSAPLVNKEKTWNEGNLFLVLIVGALLILITIIAVFALDLEKREILIISILVAVFYIIFISFMLEPQILKEITKKEIKHIEKPVIKEKIVEKPVVKFKHKIFETDKPIYVTEPKIKFHIPRYKFLGSKKTMKYHKRNCRLSKLIKRKYKVSKNEEGFFKKNGFKACKNCIDKKNRKRKQKKTKEKK